MAWETIFLDRRGKLISGGILSELFFALQFLRPNNNAHKSVSSLLIPQLLQNYAQVFFGFRTSKTLVSLAF